MSDFWDYRGWERNEENNDWQDIQGENLEFRADALMNRAISNGLDKEGIEKTITYLGAAAQINREIGRIPDLLQCLLLLGDCYLIQERGDDVSEIALETEKIALENFNDSARAKAVHLQGYNYFLKKMYSTAAAHSFSAATLYESADNLKDAFYSFISAGRLYRWRSEREESIKAFENALRVAILDEALENMVEAKTYLAYMQLRPTAIIELDEAENFLKLTKDQMLIAKDRNSTTRRFDASMAWLNVHRNPAEALKTFDRLIDYARADKSTLDTTELTLGRAYALGKLENGTHYEQALRSVLATIEELDSTVAMLEVVEPLANYYIEKKNFFEAENIWVRGRALAEKREEPQTTIDLCDQMIALCIAQYAEPARALGALESKLPKTTEKRLPLVFEHALAKTYLDNNRPTESLLVIDRALENVESEDYSRLEFAELHALRCDLLAKQGNRDAAKASAQVCFNAYLDLNEIEKAKRINDTYLKPQPGDADPATGAITIANWA